MDPDKLMFYVKNPDNLDDLSFQDLSGLVKDYPYFQAARLLYVKYLKSKKDPSFAKQLNITAAYVPDRRKLFSLLNQEPDIAVSQPEEKEIHSTKIERSSNKGIRGSRDIKKRPLRVPPSFVPVENQKEKLKKTLIKDNKPEPDKEKKERELLEFDYMASRDESAVFVLENESGTVEFIPETNHDLIEQFINKDPKIVPKENDQGRTKDISISGLNEIDEFITETLAEIYISQGYYIKAINSYEKLSLKFPEKSTYFAARIKEVENLIKNQ